MVVKSGDRGLESTHTHNKPDRQQDQTTRKAIKKQAKTYKVMEHLNNALKELPSEFSFSGIRNDILTALKKLEKQNNRRIKRKIEEKNYHEKWWGMLKNNVKNPLTQDQTLEALDQELESLGSDNQT